MTGQYAGHVLQLTSGEVISLLYCTECGCMVAPSMRIRHAETHQPQQPVVEVGSPLPAAPTIKKWVMGESVPSSELIMELETWLRKLTGSNHEVLTQEQREARWTLTEWSHGQMLLNNQELGQLIKQAFKPVAFPFFQQNG